MIFKPEHFNVLNWTQKYFGQSVSGKVVSCLDAADIANKLFQEWLEKQPMVYEATTYAGMWLHDRPVTETNKARLVMIEPIQKKCEKHEPRLDELMHVCRHCGVELVAEWRAK